MKSKLLVIVLLMTFFAAPISSARAEDLKAGSKWINDRGSEMTLTTIAANGSVKGIYVNKAPGFKCQNIPFDLTGYALADKITFTVFWKNATTDCGSMTAWTGYLVNGVIATNWSLVYTDKRINGPYVMLGSDFFSPAPLNPAPASPP